MRPQGPRAPQSPRALADRPGPPYLYQDGRLVSSTSALVVGGSGGIGQAVVRGCVEEGVGVTLVARRQDRLDQVCASLGTTVRVVPVVADAGRRAAMDRAIEAHRR